MRQIVVALLLLSALSCQVHKTDEFNFGFETQTQKNSLSDGWIKWGNYNLSIESSAHLGKKSGKITSDGAGNSFGCIAYKIPTGYSGKTIKLEGYMKLQNVENGFAGLLLRIDGNGKLFAFDNMQNQNIAGTRGWQKYSITLPYLNGAEDIFVAGTLSGKGEAWFDDFVVSIDGKDIQTLKEVKKALPPKAKLDKDFDKGSSVVLSNLTKKKIDNLELLGRVWGFLKYFHPAISKGNYNWDYELFRFLPKYLKVKYDKDRDNLLLSWIDSLGELEKCSSCKPTNINAVIKPDLKWIYRQQVSLKDKLIDVYNNRSQGNQYYVEMVPKTGNPTFKNENDYPKISFPDDGFRLLSLFRYWNMINYFFPYKDIMDQDWNLSLKEYLPSFINAKNELDYQFATLKIIGKVNDSHANLWVGGSKIEEWKGEFYAPMQVRFIQDKLVVTDFFNSKIASNAIKVGDVISKINGKSVSEIIKEKTEYYPASNFPTMLRNLSDDILRSNSKETNISFSNKNNREQTKKISLYQYGELKMNEWVKKNQTQPFKMQDDNIGYVNLGAVKKEDVPKIEKEFADTKGIIIDIRNYPSIYVPYMLGPYFVSSTKSFVKFTKANLDNPGEFTFDKDFKVVSKGKTYKGKLIVLVNELTQSAAEYSAMVLRAADNTTIIGSTTAGADGDVSEIWLPGGLQTLISGIGFYYPDGKGTQRIGIVPDIEVKPTIEGIRNHKDELMEKAIAVILKK